MYTPASFTKNLGLGSNWEKLQGAIAQGFSGKLAPVTRRAWRENAGMDDTYREVVPLDFFLFSKKDLKDDFVLPDELVRQSVTCPYSRTFDRLALFTFHFAHSGSWRGSIWEDGRVAGWSNDFIRSVVWKDGAWQRWALDDDCLLAFIQSHVLGTLKSHTKMFTNYRHMLRIAGVFEGLMGDPINLEPELWGASACKIVWDRMMYCGTIDESSGLESLLSAFLQEEIFKLMGCSQALGLTIAKSAAAEYLKLGAINRFTN